MFSDILGGFDAPGTGEDYEPGKWLIFIFSMTYLMVIALNSLIAILGDSFDKVQSDLRSYDCLQKIELLIEFNLKFPQYRESVDMKYIQVIKYLEQGSGETNAWEGKIKKVDKMINNIKASMCT